MTLGIRSIKEIKSPSLIFSCFDPVKQYTEFTGRKLGANYGLDRFLRWSSPMINQHHIAKVHQQRTCCSHVSSFGGSKLWQLPAISQHPLVSNYSTGQIYLCSWYPISQMIGSLFLYTLNEIRIYAYIYLLHKLNAFRSLCKQALI